MKFEIKKLKELRYHRKWKIIEKKERKIILTEDLEIHIIEILKIYKIGKKRQKKKLVHYEK